MQRIMSPLCGAVAAKALDCPLMWKLGSRASFTIKSCRFRAISQLNKFCASQYLGRVKAQLLKIPWVQHSNTTNVFPRPSQCEAWFQEILSKFCSAVAGKVPNISCNFHVACSQLYFLLLYSGYNVVSLQTSFFPNVSDRFSLL